MYLREVDETRSKEQSQCNSLSDSGKHLLHGRYIGVSARSSPPGGATTVYAYQGNNIQEKAYTNADPLYLTSA